MNKRQLKFFWVLLHEWLEREQTDLPPNNVKDLKAEILRMSEHYMDCSPEFKTIKEMKENAMLLESNKHPGGGGFAFYPHYCFAIGE